MTQLVSRAGLRTVTVSSVLNTELMFSSAFMSFRIYLLSLFPLHTQTETFGDIVCVER